MFLHLLFKTNNNEVWQILVWTSMKYEVWYMTNFIYDMWFKGLIILNDPYDLWLLQALKLDPLEK